MIPHKDFIGTDKSLAISLFEYGVIATPSEYREQDNAPDEWFCIYRVANDQYDSGYKREGELNDLINGKEWADEEKINSFLSTLGTTKEEWLKTDFIHKLQDCINHWGSWDIMGTPYHTISGEELQEQYEYLRD